MKVIHKSETYHSIKLSLLGILLHNIITWLLLLSTQLNVHTVERIAPTNKYIFTIKTFAAGDVKWSISY